MADIDEIVARIEADPDAKAEIVDKLQAIDSLDVDAQLEAAESIGDNAGLEEKVEELDGLIEQLAADDSLSPSDIVAIAQRVGADANIKPRTYDNIKTAAERVHARHGDHKKGEGKEEKEGKGGKGGGETEHEGKGSLLEGIIPSDVAKDGQAFKEGGVSHTTGIQTANKGQAAAPKSAGIDLK